MILIIIIVTAAISYFAFRDPEILNKYKFNPYLITHKNQWYRIITHAFLHANWPHLIINMLVLYSFGRAVIAYYDHYLGNGYVLFLLMYFGAIVISVIYSLLKHKENYAYSAVGASGAVSAVVFSAIFFAPMHKILFFAIIPIPGIIFGILYLAYSFYMGKKNVGNVAHDVHFWGAVFGLIFPLLFRPELFAMFVRQLQGF